MIDIHTHILPGIDDGAANWEDTLAMARAAAGEGITDIIATPHHANGRYTNLAESVIEQVHLVNERLNAANVGVHIHSGQEIRIHDDLLDAWDRKELLTLAQSRYMLIELPSSRVPKHTSELIYELQLQGVVPIIAHPERNAEIVEKPERLQSLIQAGAIAQVTTHSLLGGFGKKIEQSAWKLCSSGSIHLVSSDAHHLERRGFLMHEAYEAIRGRMGAEWESYFKRNAKSIVENVTLTDQPALPHASEHFLKRIFSMFGSRN